jgi:hypothetical protein
MDTAKVVDHAFRRCGLVPTQQTPETVAISKDNLYLLLLNLANRGLNLWCVDSPLVGLTNAQANYVLPAGTIHLLNVVYQKPSRASGADTIAAASFTTDLAAPTAVRRYGFKPSVGVTAQFTVEYSTDGVNWTTAQTLTSATWSANQWYWYNLDPVVTARYFRIISTTPFTLTEFYLASSVAETPMTQFNRDEYANQTTKTQTGSPCTNYYFQKTIAPSVTLWPVPNNDYDHLLVFRHRQIQDIGTLTQQIELPQQWLEPIIWQLALRLCYELPEVQDGRRAEVTQQAERYLMDGELGETDHAPVYFVPGIGVYTA